MYVVYVWTGGWLISLVLVTSDKGLLLLLLLYGKGRSWSADVLQSLAPTLKKTSPACSPSNSEDLD